MKLQHGKGDGALRYWNRSFGVIDVFWGIIETYYGKKCPKSFVYFISRDSSAVTIEQNKEGIRNLDSESLLHNPEENPFDRSLMLPLPVFQCTSKTQYPPSSSRPAPAQYFISQKRFNFSNSIYSIISTVVDMLARKFSSCTLMKFDCISVISRQSSRW